MRYLFENYTLDTEKRELHRGTDAVSITPQVFDLLDYLIRNRERVVSKDDLIIAVWNGRIVSDAALTTRLNAARNAIGDSGEEQRLLKTLARRGFRFVGQVQEERGGTASDNWAEPPKRSLTLPARPSVAVLPFVNLSLDPEQEYFADGVVEDITMALSRFHWLFVIARNSSFTYKGRNVDVRQVGRELGCATYSKAACARQEIACASRGSLLMQKLEHICGLTTLMVRLRMCSIYRTM